MNRETADISERANKKAGTVAVTPVILCGGAGSRLWPMSREDKPKQFHALVNDRSLLVNTIERMVPAVDEIAFRPVRVIGSAALGDALEKEVARAPVRPDVLVLEPCIRDTAAAVAAAIVESDPDEFLIVLPSDARIDDVAGFQKTVAAAARQARATDAIMTIGITPSRAETQYGYIEKGEPLGEGFSVTRFREKPDHATAERYLASGDFLWNAGIFLFRAGRLADEYARLQPEIWDCARKAVEEGVRDGAKLLLDPEAFAASPKLSIDYAIMEQAGNIGVVPAMFDWDDLGSWAQLYEGASKDDAGNALSGDVITVQASNNLVRARGASVAIAGVEDLVVVAEDNKILVTRRDCTHLVKNVTQAFKERGDDTHPSTVRSWLFETALPYWAEHGIDRVHGGVHEALTFDGEPAPHEAKRLRVLARQIYCFSRAKLMGWPGDADGVLEHCFHTLTTTGWHGDGGWIHLFNPDGSVRDETRDTYDHCFVMFGLAWLYRATGKPEAREWADWTLDYMDRHLADHAHGGYYETDGRKLPRRANPHMHFLEAMMAWYEATGEEKFLDRAQAMVRLFDRHFFDSATGTLSEFFDADWTISRKTPAEARIEPGHHYEWAWLISRFLDYRPLPGVDAKARQLFATAATFGHHPATGAAADGLQPDGSAVEPHARLWPQTEALKAALAFEKRGLGSAAALRRRMFDVLFAYYLNGPVPGGWYDAIDEEGHVTAPDMPSSSFYHVFCALAEYAES
ncbi:AGE family epimerase/isomerase [Oricola indica]|jgi:mannose-1-phosphate guanylyltransferase/mannose-6-phosphate isomerase|uniref:AGE family epimerase/isomerase n=1 Tax=Oricola indica TaxID=2872591 RepID=UPI001CBCB6BC|nr:AGE family epimerase/isomerase [Oricola indica]